jgi:phosphatidate cytidylyltransferase
MMSKKKIYRLFGFIFLFLSFYTIYRLRIDNDYLFILLITIICVSTDIGGYIFGKIFKGPKLTKFSPNKTYAGMIGGFLLSIISAIIFNFYFNKEIQIDFFIFVILISTTSQLGDIIISYFKRLSKIKDTGKIIPGHGGLLDRVDGMIFAFPLSYLILLTDVL